MGSALLITLREGLEAGLIVAIILAYLKSTNQRPHFRTVLVAAAAAVAVSLVIGAAIFAVAGEFEGRSAVAFEGVAMLAAVGVLTWMIVWMKRQSASIKGSLEREMAAAIGMGSVLALALIPFTAILREGLETAVFLFAATRTSTPLESTVGATAGIVLAVGLTWGLYSGGYRVNLRTFFNVTGVLLIVFAAGLLAHGIHELQEAALLPTFVEHVWDANHVADDGSGVGLWLKALLGYNGNPSLLEVIAYPLYLAVAVWYFVDFRPTARSAVSTVGRRWKTICSLASASPLHRGNTLTSSSPRPGWEDPLVARPANAGSLRLNGSLSPTKRGQIDQRSHGFVRDITRNCRDKCD